MNISSWMTPRFAARLHPSSQQQNANPAQTATFETPPDSFVKFGAKSDWTRTEKPGEYIEYTHPKGRRRTQAQSPFGFWQQMKKDTFGDKYPPSQTLYWMMNPKRGGCAETDLDRVFEYLRDTYHATIAREAAEKSQTLDIPTDLYEMSNKARRQYIEQLPDEKLDALLDAQNQLGYLRHVANRQLRAEMETLLKEERFKNNALVQDFLKRLGEPPSIQPEREWTPAFITQFEAGLSREIEDIPEDASIFQETPPEKIADFLQEVLDVKCGQEYSPERGKRILEDIRELAEEVPELAEPLMEKFNRWKEGRFEE